MTKEKQLQYKKAYVELNEVLKFLLVEQKEKIPKEFIENLVSNMDTSYSFEFDKSKGIFEQDLMVETQALLIGIYEKYLAPESEKELWEKYDCICLNKIEEKRREQYNPNNLFKNNNFQKQEVIENEVTNHDMQMSEYKGESFIIRIINKLKEFFRKKI